MVVVIVVIVLLHSKKILNFWKLHCGYDMSEILHQLFIPSFLGFQHLSTIKVWFIHSTPAENAEDLLPKQRQRCGCLRTSTRLGCGHEAGGVGGWWKHGLFIPRIHYLQSRSSKEFIGIYGIQKGIPMTMNDTYIHTCMHAYIHAYIHTNIHT